MFVNTIRHMEIKKPLHAMGVLHSFSIKNILMIKWTEGFFIFMRRIVFLLF